MDTATDVLFSPLKLRNIVLPNRFIRSATYEAWGDRHGMPQPGLGKVYTELAQGGTGTIITGFVYTSPAGRAMQPGQCGIDTASKMERWRDIVDQVRDVVPDVKLFMQIAHTGRQTRHEVTGLPVVGVSSRKCTYFKQRVTVLDDTAIRAIIDEFADAACRAQQAGLDGVQVHAAHGYLIHQFLSPWTNTRTDRWAERPLFLEEVIGAVREKCGERFPILVKLSGGEDREPGLQLDDVIATAKRLEAMEIDALEISYGTMETALNIIRGATPVETVLKVNPLFNRHSPLAKSLWKKLLLRSYLRKFIPFTENYNVAAASAIKKETSLPVIPVGGIRSMQNITACLTTHGLDAVSLCRPLISEPDLPSKIRLGVTDRSACMNCNLCTVYCDSLHHLRCYQKRRTIS